MYIYVCQAFHGLGNKVYTVIVMNMSSAGNKYLNTDGNVHGD